MLDRLAPVWVMEAAPAWMQVELYILPSTQDAFDHTPHWCIAEICSLQRFNEEGCGDIVVAESVEQEAKAVLAAVRRAGHVFLAYRSATIWISKRAIDIKFSIDSHTNFYLHMESVL